MVEAMVTNVRHPEVPARIARRLPIRTARAEPRRMHGPGRRPSRRSARERSADPQGDGERVRHVADRHRGCSPSLPAAARPAGARARGRVARGAPARIRRAARPVRLRQVDPALSARRLPADRDRQDRRQRQAGERAGARPRHRVPAFRPVPVEDGARQHPVRARAAGHAARGAREARAGTSSIWSGCRVSRTASRPSSPAA